jgi:hypothetical protein
MENHSGMILTGGKLLIHPPELSGNSTSSKAGGTGKENEFFLTKYLFHTSNSLVL